MHDLALHLLALLFAAAVIAGFVDAIAGGGGLITIPVMLITGIPPLESIATNKLQAQFGVASATIAYARRGHINLRKQMPMALMAILGGILGALLASLVPATMLAAAIPFLLIGIALFFALKPNLSDLDSHQRITPLLFGLTAVPLIGLYDGVSVPAPVRSTCSLSCFLGEWGC